MRKLVSAQVTTWTESRSSIPVRMITNKRNSVLQLPVKTRVSPSLPKPYQFQDFTQKLSSPAIRNSEAARGILDQGPISEQHWRTEIETHPLYRWLIANEGFRKALSASERGKVKGIRSQRDWKLELTKIFAHHLYIYYFQVAHGVTPKFPDSGARKKALQLASKLMRIIEEDGVSLSSPFQHRALRGCLASLQREMRLATNRPRNDPELPQRKAFLGFCIGLSHSFGAISPTIAGHFGSAIGYTSETQGRLIRQAKATAMAQLKSVGIGGTTP